MALFTQDRFQKHGIDTETKGSTVVGSSLGSWNRSAKQKGQNHQTTTPQVLYKP